MNLYLLALLPAEKLREEIRLLKLEMKDRFGAGHALKSLAHITLQMPFRKACSEEEPMIARLNSLSSTFRSFLVELNGFSAFPPRVIFLHIENPNPIKKMRKKLLPVLREELKIPAGRTDRVFNPHLTIATRDLTEDTFNSAWPEYQNRPFAASFKVDSFFLLKHNGKFWDIFKEFEFSKA